MTAEAREQLELLRLWSEAAQMTTRTPAADRAFAAGALNMLHNLGHIDPAEHRQWFQRLTSGLPPDDRDHRFSHTP